MRNLNVYDGDTSGFLDEIIASKKNSIQNPGYKERLGNIAPTVRVLFNNYDIAHNSNNHIGLEPHGFIKQDKDDLLKLYSSKNARIIKLKNDLTTILDNRVISTCQYCTIAPVESLDHIVPKGYYPEFSVNPKNLFPACSTCNSHKLEYWRAEGKKLFLNLYTDILPDVQYLYVDLSFHHDNTILPTYELRNTNNIDIHIFELLKSHYSRLFLLERFKKESHKIISELTSLITVISRQQISQEQIVQIISDKIEEDKKLFGVNYYKSILERAMINDIGYLNMVFGNNRDIA